MPHTIKNITLDDCLWAKAEALQRDMGLTGKTGKAHLLRRLIDIVHTQRFRSASVSAIVQNACDAVRRFNPALGELSPGMVSYVVIAPDGHIKVFFKGDSEPTRISQSIWDKQ